MVKSNEEIILTRYLDLNKFVTLLSMGLYIPRADMFEDKIEGIVPYPDADTINFYIYDTQEIQRLIDDLEKTTKHEEVFYYINQHIEYYLNDHRYIKENPFCNFEELNRAALFIHMQMGDRKNYNKETIVSELRELFFILYKETFKSTLISCWYSDVEESLPMWNMYTQTKGVAIQTTNKKFDNVVNENDFKCISRKVEYPDNFDEEFKNWKQKEYFEDHITDFYSKDMLSYPNYWFFRKRPCFKYEHEYRFILEYNSVLSSLFGKTDENSAKAKGMILKINNLDEFIDKIIIAPKARPEFIGLISSLAKDYGIKESKIEKSKIRDLG